MRPLCCGTVPARGGSGTPTSIASLTRHCRSLDLNHGLYTGRLSTGPGTRWQTAWPELPHASRQPHLRQWVQP
eukprot:10298779-Prorocentrum_lima.AAC.1